MKIARHLPLLTTALTCMHVSSNTHNPVDSSRHIRSYEHMIMLSLGPHFILFDEQKQQEYSASPKDTTTHSPVK